MYIVFEIVLDLPNIHSAGAIGGLVRLDQRPKEYPHKTIIPIQFGPTAVLVERRLFTQSTCG